MLASENLNPFLLSCINTRKEEQWLTDRVFPEGVCFLQGPLACFEGIGLQGLARRDEGSKAMFVGECIGRTSKAWVFYFGLDWGWQRMFQAKMNPVQNLYPEHGGQGFQNGGQGKGDGESHLCRVPLPLTLSTLTGQRSNLRKL